MQRDQVCGVQETTRGSHPSRRTSRAAAIAATLSVVGLVALACSASGDDGDGSGNGTTGAGGIGAGGVGAGGGSGRGGALGTDGGILTEAGICATDNYGGILAPLDMYMMIDSTGSMGNRVGATTKWAAVTDAIKSFVQDPQSADIGLGLQYFGIPGDPSACPTKCQDCSCWMNQCKCVSCSTIGTTSTCSATEATCDPAVYEKPAIPIGRCSTVAPQIVSSLNAQKTFGGTPTYGALQGALRYAGSWAKAHVDHIVVVLLATDGEPTVCDILDIPTIAGLAQGACTAAPPVRTFVIGIGVLQANLDTLAQGGCTNKAFMIDVNGDVMQQFRAALDDIRMQAGGCEYLIPLPESGMPDYQKMNVSYTPSTGGPGQILGYVDRKDQCDPVRGGWYYDDPFNPKRIILCPASCDVLRVDKHGRIDVLLGCRRIVY